VVVSTDTVTTLSASAERSTAAGVVTLTANVEAISVMAARGGVPGADAVVLAGFSQGGAIALAVACGHD
jgi:predicted esterase